MHRPPSNLNPKPPRAWRKTALNMNNLTTPHIPRQSKSDRILLIQLKWHNPYSSPPKGMERIQFESQIRESEYNQGNDEIKQLEETFPPGSGWSWHWSLAESEFAPPKKWSKEAKGRVRKKRLKDRLLKKHPLFWEDFYNQELEARPEYFEGEDPVFVPLHQ